MLDKEDGSLMHCMAWRLAVGILHASAVSIRVHSFEQRSRDSITLSSLSNGLFSTWSRPHCG